jgi:hypothetical protein
LLKKATVGETVTGFQDGSLKQVDANLASDITGIECH